jgi:hypothetical protein
MLKKIIVTVVLFLLALPVYFQIAHVNAADLPLTGPMTPPITSGITPTVMPSSTPTMTPTATPTGTITPTMNPTMTPTVTPTPTPATAGTLSGHVKYRKLGWVAHNTPRASDAAGVIITVNKFFGGGSKMTTTTDVHGNYSFDLPAGMYTVKADDNTGAFFVPTFTVVHIHDGDHKTKDFQGLMFGSF